MCHCEELATKQSHKIKDLQNTRLLRFARNDHFGTFYETINFEFRLLFDS
jgi:hypothetical protein